MCLIGPNYEEKDFQVMLLKKQKHLLSCKFEDVVWFCGAAASADDDNDNEVNSFAKFSAKMDLVTLSDPSDLSNATRQTGHDLSEGLFLHSSQNA